MPDPSVMGLAMKPVPRCLGLATMPDQRCLDLATHVKPKQTSNKKKAIVHFSCQEREKKEKTQAIDHRRQSNHDVYTRRTMWKKAQLRIYLYGEWSDLTSEKHFTLLLNSSSAAHLLGAYETRVNSFSIKK